MINKLVIIILGFFLIIGCKAQTGINNKAIKKDTTMIEKFNFEDYNRRMENNPMGFTYVENDGTHIVLGGPPGPSIRETPPLPKFYQIYKEYYDNGNIKKKGKMLGGEEIGTWEYYDISGNKTIEEKDNKFGKFSYNDVYKFLEKEGLINLATGEGRENVNLSFESSIILDLKTWTVSTAKNGYYYKFILNSDTGKIVSRIKKGLED